MLVHIVNELALIALCILMLRLLRSFDPAHFRLLTPFILVAVVLGSTLVHLYSDALDFAQAVDDSMLFDKLPRS